MAAIAELEAGSISDRTKAAPAAYRDRGGLLGSARPGAERPRRPAGVGTVKEMYSARKPAPATGDYGLTATKIRKVISIIFP